MIAAAQLFATTAFAQDEKPAWIDKSLASKAIHEECMALKTGDRLEYAFDAHDKLDFNIHYHLGDTVHFPVQSFGARHDEGAFVAAADQGYCLMWSNAGAETVELRYRFLLRKR